jgi:hypothetical protein
MPRKRHKPEEIVAKLRHVGGSPGKLLSPARRRVCIEHVRRGLGVIPGAIVCDSRGFRISG